MIRQQKHRFSYETLEEVALRVQVRPLRAQGPTLLERRRSRLTPHTNKQESLKGFNIPHCAFNGGNDVWVDVGNKALGVRALQAFMGPTPIQSLHVGDRFTRTGNDTRARQVSSSLWVSDPRETKFVMRCVRNQGRSTALHCTVLYFIH